MMGLTVLGVIFIVVTLDVTIEAGSSIVQVDALPDFIGYLILFFSMEKSTKLNGWFKNASGFCTVMLGVTFLNFISGWGKALLPTNIIEARVLSVMLNIVYTLFGFIGPFIIAASMIYLSFLSRGFGLELENRGNKTYPVIFFIITILFYIVAAVCVLLQFFKQLPLQTWYFTVPVSILFCVFAFITSENIKELR